MEPVQAAWLKGWRALRRYHRYEVHGFEHLQTSGAALLVGYHGRPLAYDLCMLTTVIHERLGYLPHGVIHGAFKEQSSLSRMVDDLGFVTGDGPGIQQAVAAGEHILLQPGGTREGCRSFRHRYQVDWGNRTGYLRLALRYRLPIIPIAGSGMDDAFIGFNNGYRLGKRLGVPAGMPLWLGVGLGVWPLALPLPVKMTQHIGKPILDLQDPGKSAGEPDSLRNLHEKVMAAVQGLLDKARGK